MLIAVLKNKLIVSFVTNFDTLLFPLGLSLDSHRYTAATNDPSPNTDPNSDPTNRINTTKNTRNPDFLATFAQTTRLSQTEINTQQMTPNFQDVGDFLCLERR